jgi:hypothetical protein
VTEPAMWRRCSACKQPIAQGAVYWVCNVSTCNRSRTALAFCSLTCWEVHLPEAHHREAWALERTAPHSAAEFGGGPGGARPGGATRPAAAAGNAAAEREGQRRLVRPAKGGRNAAPREILVIVTRLKEYVRARSGFHTSDGVLEPLSEAIRNLCDEAILKAEREGRRTLLDRDIPEV